MSVLIPDLSVYNYILNGLELAAYRKVCDEHYAYCMHLHFERKEIHKESQRLVKSWLDLNHRSYQYKYENGKKETSLWQFVNIGLTNVRPLQLLKYIQCVLYNIELYTIKENGGEVTKQEEEDYKLLEVWKEHLAFAIIDKLPEYDKAKWSEPPVETKFNFANNQ